MSDSIDISVRDADIEDRDKRNAELEQELATEKEQSELFLERTKNAMINIARENASLKEQLAEARDSAHDWNDKYEHCCTENASLKEQLRVAYNFIGKQTDLRQLVAERDSLKRQKKLDERALKQDMDLLTEYREHLRIVRNETNEEIASLKEQLAVANMTKNDYCTADCMKRCGNYAGVKIDADHFERENASLTERLRRWETGGNNMTLDAKNEEIASLKEQLSVTEDYVATFVEGYDEGYRDAEKEAKEIK